MPRARVRDIDVHWERRGSGPRLLYLSGTGGDLRNTPSIFDSPLAERFEILAFDQRGQGQTSDPPGPFSMEGYALDALAMLDLAGWERAHVLGVSFGGMVLQHLAVLAPDRLDRLVMAVTSSGGAGEPSFPLHRLYDLPEQERGEKLAGLLDARLAGSAGSGLPLPAWNPKQIEARRLHDAWDRLPEISRPVLVVAGRHDGIAPPDNGRRLAARIPGARFAEFEGGHRVLWEDPRAFAEIASFLEEVSG